jgi:hypothetical protein
MPKDEHLQLPSAFTPQMRHSLALDDLGTVEYSLREGQAYNALSSLRQVIQEYNYNLLAKNTKFMEWLLAPALNHFFAFWLVINGCLLTNTDELAMH